MKPLGKGQAGMEKAENATVIIESTPISDLPVDQDRQSIIEGIALDSLSKGCNELEALGMLFWKLADSDPPVSYEEQVLLCAFHRMHQSYLDLILDSYEKAFELLEISTNRLNLPHKEMIRKAKVAYWKQFNDLSPDLRSLLSNANRIGIKKKALGFICSHRSILKT